MIIDYKDGDSAAAIINSGVVGYTVDLDIANNTGYPCDGVHVLGTSDDGSCIVICETGDDGARIGNATWEVPIDLVARLTVL